MPGEREVVGSPALPSDAYSYRQSTDYIVIHCADTDASMDVGAAEIRHWHADPPPRGNGWKDIGYHYVIRRNGVIERGRPRDAIGSHVKGWNHNSVGVCLVGGSDGHHNEQNNFTPAQWDALKWLVTTLTHIWPRATIQGHRDFPDVHKFCPSFDARQWARENIK